MYQGDDERIRRKAYEIWESEGRPEGRHNDHWRRAHDNFKLDKTTAEIAGDTDATAARDSTPAVSAADERGEMPSPQSSAEDMDTQDRAMIPQNSAERLSQNADPEPGSEPTPPAKRPRTQRRKTAAP
jgi:hypothetical protein